MAEVEEPLAGGNVSRGVVRVGNTVRRPVGPWTPAVHALLRHLERVGFDAAPRVLGIDASGREILTYAPGAVIGLSEPDPLESDENLARVGALVADYHRAVASFDPPSDAAWSDFAADPRGGGIVLHNDLAPWNIVVDSDAWSVIDWDFAAPGHPAWEIAYALHSCVPLWPDSPHSDLRTVQRIRVFADACGLDRRQTLEALELVPRRCRAAGHALQQRAAAGDATFVGLVRDGHDRSWLATAEHVDDRLSTWKTILPSNS